MNYREVAIRYLNTGFKSVWQVKEHLKKKEATAQEIEEAVGFLLELGYLNDRRLSALTFKREYEKGRAKGRTIMYLKAKGVSGEDIEKGYYDYLDELADQPEGNITYDIMANGQIDEGKMALREAQKIAGSGILDDKLRGKIARRLATKGFSPQAIYGALDKLK